MSDAPPPPAGFAETHISLLFFVGDRAYKLKKPVAFPFVDLTTRAERHRLCHREVELNRRLAPDVYLGVADVVGVDGEPCDHLVVMRRLPTERRLSTLVADGSPEVAGVLDELAALLAHFHAAAERSAAIDTFATREAVAALWRENLDEIEPFAGGVLDADTFADVRRASGAYLAGREALFASRIASGAVCDGHGDLQTDDVFCLEDGPRVLDCIEFHDPFRYGDVVNDLAFPVMDLERLGAPELAGRLVEAYEAAAGQEVPRSLLHSYVAYRALVRCKVTCLRAAQVAGSAEATAAEERAGTLLDLCRSHLRRALPRLVLVGGLPGTGKSSLARALGEQRGWPVLRSDVVRKELAGLGATDRAEAGFGEGLYDEDTTGEVYAELASLAHAALAMGDTVVLDASFMAARHRELMRVAAGDAHAEVVELRCTVDRAEADRRISARRAEGSDASDATPGVAAAMEARADAWPEAVTIDTTGDRAASLGQAQAALDGTGASTTPVRPSFPLE